MSPTDPFDVDPTYVFLNHAPDSVLREFLDITIENVKRNADTIRRLAAKIDNPVHPVVVSTMGSLRWLDSCIDLTYEKRSRISLYAVESAMSAEEDSEQSIRLLEDVAGGIHDRRVEQMRRLLSNASIMQPELLNPLAPHERERLMEHFHV